MTNPLSRDAAFAVADPALNSIFIVRMPFSFNSLTELIAEQVTPTFHKTPAQARFSQGSNDYYPGTTDVDGISVTFYEAYTYSTSKWLNSWRRMVYDPITSNFGVPKSYKQNIVVEAYSRFSTSPVRTITYTGCWPTDRGPYEYNYTDETGRITVQAQFSVDSVSEV